MRPNSCAGNRRSFRAGEWYGPFCAAHPFERCLAACDEQPTLSSANFLRKTTTFCKRRASPPGASEQTTALILPTASQTQNAIHKHFSKNRTKPWHPSQAHSPIRPRHNGKVRHSHREDQKLFCHTNKPPMVRFTGWLLMVSLLLSHSPTPSNLLAILQKSPTPCHGAFVVCQAQIYCPLGGVFSPGASGAPAGTAGLAGGAAAAGAGAAGSGSRPSAGGAGGCAVAGVGQAASGGCTGCP